MRKRGQIGDMIEMIPRLVIISIVAVAVFTIASVFYPYDISVRDVEARLLAVSVVECLSGDGVIDLDLIDEEYYDEVLSYCGLDVGERGYVGVKVFDSSGDEVERLVQGDSGAVWVRDLFEKAVLTGNAVSGLEDERVEKIAKYNPGYYDLEYPVFVKSEGERFEGSVKLEVLMNYE